LFTSPASGLGHPEHNTGRQATWWHPAG